MSVVDISNLFGDAASSPSRSQRWYVCHVAHDQLHKEHYACSQIKWNMEVPKGDKILVSISAGCPQMFDQLTLSCKLKGPVSMEIQGHGR